MLVVLDIVVLGCCISNEIVLRSIFLCFHFSNLPALLFANRLPAGRTTVSFGPRKETSTPVAGELTAKQVGEQR